MIQIGEILIGLLVLSGALISALSAFGLIRLPDVYLRSHAATKSATLGVLFILVGAFSLFCVIFGACKRQVAAWHRLCIYNSTCGRSFEWTSGVPLGRTDVGAKRAG